MQQLVQFLDDNGTRRVGLMANTSDVRVLTSTDSVYALFHRGLAERRTLAALVEEFVGDEAEPMAPIVDDGRLLPAFDHPVTDARSFVWQAESGLKPLAPSLAATAFMPGDSTPPNAIAVTVDSHQHLTAVGRAAAEMTDGTLALSGALQLVDEDDTELKANVASLETELGGQAELQFGDVIFVL